MDPAPHPPQPPPLDRAWADPLILTLALLACLLASATLRQRAAPRSAPTRASLASRLLEGPFMGSRLVPPEARRFLRPVDWPAAMARAGSPWDRTLVAVHAAEAGQVAVLEAALPALAPEAQGVLGHAYRNAASPGTAALDRVRAALRGTAAEWLLAARLEEVDGRPGGPFRNQAQQFARRRLVGLGWLAGVVILLGLGGLGFLVHLVLRRPATAPPQDPSLSGRALLLVLLGWFNLLLLSGSLVQPVAAHLPLAYRPLALPLATGLHGAGGLWLLLRLSGRSLADLRGGLCPGGWRRPLGQALGFLGLGVVAIFTLGLLLAPWLKGRPHAQGDLLEGFAAPHPWAVTTALFLTVAVLAPVLEELLFRGALQSWLGRRWRPWVGVVVAALAFGASHLLPTALPTLSTLGLVLGLAFLRTRDLRTSILVHGAWNGGIFLAVRLLA